MSHSPSRGSDYTGHVTPGLGNLAPILESAYHSKQPNCPTNMIVRTQSPQTSRLVT